MEKLIPILMAIASMIVLFYSVSSVFSLEEPPLVSASDQRIQIIGRFDRNLQGSVLFDWPGVSIRFDARGKSCSIQLFDVGNVYNVFVDGTFQKKISPIPSQLIYNIFSSMDDSTHQVLITKRTESSYGVGRFDGVIPGRNCELVSPPARTSRRIEIYGDSYSCGYGNEGNGLECGSLKDSENNYLAYGPIMARQLGAECSTIAISGKGLVRNYGSPDKTSPETMPYYYNRKLQSLVDPWDFTQYVPQIIIVNLGINDFSTEPHPDKESWISAYVSFIELVRSQNPMASIICISIDNAPQRDYVVWAVEQLEKKGFQNILFQKLPELKAYESGCDNHPNVKAHQRIALELIPAAQKLTGWI